MRNWNLLNWMFIATGIALVSGCGDDNESVVVATPRGVAVATNTDSAANAVLFAAADPFIPLSANITTAEQAAATAAAAVNNYYQNNCATATATGATITYH